MDVLAVRRLQQIVARFLATWVVTHILPWRLRQHTHIHTLMCRSTQPERPASERSLLVILADDIFRLNCVLTPSQLGAKTKTSVNLV